MPWPVDTQVDEEWGHVTRAGRGTKLLDGIILDGSGEATVRIDGMIADAINMA